MGIEWRESLSVGIEEIDNQHKELLRRFDRMLVACKEGKGAEELRQLLHFLNEYVVTHFKHEEHIQRIRKYPDYEAHHQEHESFIARIRKLEEEINQEGVSVHNIIETNNMMLKWLMNHISVVDKKLGSYLQSAPPQD